MSWKHGTSLGTRADVGGEERLCPAQGGVEQFEHDAARSGNRVAGIGELSTVTADILV